MAESVSFTYRPDGEREILSSAQWRDSLQQVGNRIAADARQSAPRRARGSQGGAASIHAETRMTPRGWEVRISWTKSHYYMLFREKGTVHEPARPFLRPALDRARGNV
jgi:HK97 gp10 family phage protein